LRRCAGDGKLLTLCGDSGAWRCDPVHDRICNPTGPFYDHREDCTSRRTLAARAWINKAG
jgi:hypothetical protein